MDYKTRTFAASERAYGGQTTVSILAERSVFGGAAFLQIENTDEILGALHLGAAEARALAAHLLEIVGEEPAPLEPFFAVGDRVVVHGAPKEAGVGVVVSVEPVDSVAEDGTPHLFAYTVRQENDGRHLWPYETEMGEYDEDGIARLSPGEIVRVIDGSTVFGDHAIGDAAVVEVVDGDAVRLRSLSGVIADRKTGHGPTGRSWWLHATDVEPVE